MIFTTLVLQDAHMNRIDHRIYQLEQCDRQDPPRDCVISTTGP